MKKQLPRATSKDILKVFKKFCKKEMMFTKYDITKKLRHKGFLAFHNEVKDVIDNKAKLPKKYMKDVLATKGNPEIFFLKGSDVADYNPNNIPEFNVTKKDKKKIKKNDAKNTSNDVKDTSKDAKAHWLLGSIPKRSNNKMFDVRGRFTVKAGETKCAGFVPGQVVCICINDNLIEIKDHNANGKYVTVDCYFNIRITKSLFEEAFGIVPNEVDVVASKNKIKIKKKVKKFKNS